MTQPTPKRKPIDDAPPPHPPGVKAGPPPDGAVRGAPEEGKKEPEFGTARQAEPTGELPRVIDQLERATSGTVRFKVAVRNYSPQKTRYVLARPGDEAAAVACALAANGLDRELDRLRKLAGDKAGEVEAPAVVVTALPD